MATRLQPGLSTNGAAPAACPNCSGKESAFWCRGRDLLNFVSTDIFEYRRCRRCGSLFPAHPPEGETLGSYYPHGYGPYRNAGKSADLEGPGSAAKWLAPIDGLFARVFRRARDGRGPLDLAIHAFYESPIPGQSKLLDFGCGSTAFSNRARNQGWRAAGADIQTAVVEALRAEGHEGFLVADGLDGLPENEFDAIRVNHVVEHMARPRHILAALYRTLKPGGRIHLATPNAGSLAAAAFKEYWLGLDAPRHLCIFTADGLRDALMAAGFANADVFQEIVSKDVVRSLGRFLKPIVGSRRAVERMAVSQADPALLYPLGLLMARMNRSDRIHVFAEKLSRP